MTDQNQNADDNGSIESDEQPMREKARPIAFAHDKYTHDSGRCEHPDCERQAKAVYEGPVGDGVTVRFTACWECGTAANPLTRVGGLQQ